MPADRAAACSPIASDNSLRQTTPKWSRQLQCDRLWHEALVYAMVRVGRDVRSCPQGELARQGSADLHCLGTGNTPCGSLPSMTTAGRSTSLRSQWRSRNAPLIRPNSCPSLDEFISKFLHLLSATAVTHPATARMLIVADALTALITMHYKAHFNRPRPTQVVPGLLTPIQHGGHASFPSGHATQAHVFATASDGSRSAILAFGSYAGRPRDPRSQSRLASLPRELREIAKSPACTIRRIPSAGVKLAEAITSKILL